MLEKLPDVVGHLLRDTRAGLEELAFHKVDLRGGTAAITVTSLGFADHAPLPEKYTADGVGVSPSLAWTGLPAATRSVLLIAEDADAPTPQPLVHAIVVGLSPEETALAEAAMPSADNQGTGLHVGRNSFLQAAWLPPDPPPGHGVHRYAFQVFALGSVIAFDEHPGRDAVLEALAAHGLASGCLIGTYQRPDTSIRGDEPEAVVAPAPALDGGLTLAG